MSDNRWQLASVAAAAALAGAAATVLITRRLSPQAERCQVNPVHAAQPEACRSCDEECSTLDPESSSEGQPSNGKFDPFAAAPRQGYLKWDEYFMFLCFLSAQRSKDPNKQVGACIVSQDQIILGIGYNGFPRGCADSHLPWAKKSRAGDPLQTKYPYVCHAEMNAILNKNHASLTGAKLYVTMFPCNECAKLLIQAGVKEVIFYEDKLGGARGSTTGGIRPDQAYAASKLLLDMAGVMVRQLHLAKPLTITLGSL
ncbi:hypothetical protein WJX72_005107 [[Myrmecia] bisecta]|uniref:dCMP deaminase n=1 Tax=[Myrmecia] bisecta TaxID=41462 RepID=A0AAW1Q7V4_9CHLO